MAMETQKEILLMTLLLIKDMEIKHVLQRLKNKKSYGPDGCKPELYKALLTKNDIPHEWTTSNHYTMIPKQAEPTAKDLTRR